jgi:N6-L-threonylcarbamoyladenine synthase
VCRVVQSVSLCCKVLSVTGMCLLVSGGHNLLVLMKGVGCYTQLGTTLDDALVE